MTDIPMQNVLDGVAVIGMSGRFPEAGSINEFWERLRSGKECITYFSKDDALASGIDKKNVNDSNYVLAGGILEDIELFDASFFGLNPREAENLDPQQRLFLECSYEALENAGYSCNQYDYPIGVYAGSNMSYYFLYHLFNKLGVKDDLAIAIGNDKDYLATRTSYEFNLKGPSINIQTACSTSMTAIAMAYEGLLNYHCDMALAGGAGIKLPQKMGYLFQTGFIGSPDGHTRPFDADAAGTIFTSAVGVLLLKRMEDAVRDGDHIYAVIRGIAVNNDGSTKVGFTAPSREGEAEVIAAAQNLAAVNPEDISYIEAHGTGTSLGDPIEISALTRVFEQTTKRKSFCAIGSVKGNIGHAISGAGVAGMIKTILALAHKEIPPSINFEAPNPKIDFENSPFYVNTKLAQWESEGKPRLAGVSSFGFGGTNVHAVLEEAPQIEVSPVLRMWHLITLSAKTPEALDKMCQNLAVYFRANPSINFADAAYTLHVGRKEFDYRRAIVCKDINEAIYLLELKSGEGIYAGKAKDNELANSEIENLIGSIDSNEKKVLEALGKLWVEGSFIDWSEFHKHEKRLRIPLPTYPFERKRYWVEQYNMEEYVKKSSKVSERSADYKDWLYFPTWKRAASLPFDSNSLDKNGYWLLFVDETGFGEKIAKYLVGEGTKVITVTKGDSFREFSDTEYYVNPSSKSDYKALLDSLCNLGRSPKTIMHFWNVAFDTVVSSRLEFSEKCQIEGFCSLLFLTQVLGECYVAEDIRLTVISNNMHSIGGERVVYPEKATLLGGVRVIPMEYTNISCQSIDILLSEKDSYNIDRLEQQVLAEMTCKKPELVVAIRDSHRWIQIVEPIKIEIHENGDWLREGGTYLITGGLGGIGLAAAGYMARRAKINLVLTGRSFFPEREKWQEWINTKDAQDKTSIKIKQLLHLEELGSEVMVVNADVSNLEQMRAAIEDVKTRFGDINGVIHSAGVSENGLIQEKGMETVKRVFAPKVKGTVVIDELFKDRELDFIVLFSSSSSILGEAGFIDYCGANGFLDAYACYKNSTSKTYTVAIDWEEWDEVGMAVATNSRSRRQKITVNEGLKLLDSIITSKTSEQIVVAPDDFISRLEDIQKFRCGALEEKQAISDSIDRIYNRPEVSNPYVPPKNKTEEIIAKIWEEQLGVYPVGINDDFFELGGHSLLATSLISILRKTFQRNISLQSFLENSTVKNLAETLMSDGEKCIYSTITPVREKEYYIASSAQTGMYLLYKLSGTNSINYNINSALEIEGGLDVERLEKVFQALVRRHEVFRTSFEYIDGQVVQRICKGVDFKITLLESDEASVKNVINGFIKPFDLGKAPLLRVGLIKLGTNKSILICDMHHIVADGYSAGILFSELIGLYKGRELPLLSIQYKDYSEWHNNLLSSIKNQEEYWLNLFSGEIPLLNMPLDHMRGELQTFEGNTIREWLPEEISQKLEGIAKKYNVTLNTVLFSIYSILLHKYSGHTDLVIGTASAGRTQVELQNLIGMFAKTLLIRVVVNPVSSLAEMFDSVSKAINGMLDNQEYPYNTLVEKLSSKIDHSRNPLFDTMLIYHNEAEQNLNFEINGLKFTSYNVEKNSTRLDFQMDVFKDNGKGLRCLLEYNTGLFNEQTMNFFMRNFIRLAKLIAENPEYLISQIEIDNTKSDIEETKHSSLPQTIMAVSATFTSEPIEEYIKLWCKQFNMSVEVKFAPYNQVFQELLQPASLISTNTGINVLLIRFEDWIRGDASDDEVKCKKLVANFNELSEIIKRKSKQAPYFIGLFPAAAYLPLSDKVLGCLEQINAEWKNVLSQMENVNTIDFNDLTWAYSIEEIYNLESDRAGHIPFTDEYFAAMGTHISRSICTWKQNRFKVLVLDCDNTLWKGICGEDGALGISVDEPFMELQKLAVKKYNEGMLLAICSKNNESDVWKVFDTNRDMLLKREHFVSWKINWSNKSENIKQLAKELNLGLDSFIFIDDSPMECAEVMLNCPEVLTIQLPEAIEQIPLYLNHLWAFDKHKITREDINRTSMYVSERKRQEIQSSNLSLDDFLNSLKLEMTMNFVNEQQIARVAQMTQRTNQFNLSSIRRTEEEIRSLMNTCNCWGVEVKDRFGDYGLVGLIICKTTGQKLFIDTFLLSCRVLGRRVENAILTGLRNYCESMGLTSIEAEFYPTDRNAPFLGFLNNTKWQIVESREGVCKYILNVSDISKHIDFIQCRFGILSSEALPVSTVDKEIIFSKESFENATHHKVEAAPYLGHKDVRKDFQTEMMNGSEYTHKDILNNDKIVLIYASKYTQKANWTVNMANEDNLLHKRYLLPLMYPSAVSIIKFSVKDSNKSRNMQGLEYESPRDELESRLASVWSRVLYIDNIGINNSFFELGGNSLNAIKLEVEMGKNGFEIDYVDIFKYKTIKNIADYLRGSDEAAITVTENVIEKAQEKENETEYKTQVNSIDTNRKEIENIEPFNDVFYKNCFYNSAFPVAKHFSRSELPFLINDVLIYTYNKQIEPDILKAEYISCRNIEQLLNSEGITVNSKSKCSDAIKDIIYSVSKDRPVIISVDCFYISIRNDTYQKIHMPHSWLVYGYDKNEKVLNIIEHKHMENLSYEKRVASFEDAQNAYYGFLDNYFESDKADTFYEFFSQSLLEKEVIGDNAQRYINVFASNILQNNERINTGLRDLEEFVRGLEQVIINEEALSGKIENIIDMLNDIINKKQVERYKIEKLFGLQNSCIKLLADIIDSWSFIRAKLARYMYSSAYNPKSMSASAEKLNIIYGLEKEYYEKLFSMMHEQI